MLAQMLDREPQPARTGWPEHQPVRARRKVLLGQSLAEQLVVDAEVFDLRPGSSGSRWFRRFQTRNGHSGEPARYPALHGTAAQPFILERRKLSQILKGANLFASGPSSAWRQTPARTGTRSRDLKCHWIMSRTCASSCSLASRTFSEICSAEMPTIMIAVTQSGALHK